MKEKSQSTGDTKPRDSKININSMEIPPKTPPKVNPATPKK
jgi:hypothetical protein